MSEDVTDHLDDAINALRAARRAAETDVEKAATCMAERAAQEAWDLVKQGEVPPPLDVEV